MKRETWALVIGLAIVSVIVMNTNTAVSNQMLASAITRAESTKIDLRSRPARQQAGQQADRAYSHLLETDFGINSESVSMKDILVLQGFLAESGYLDEEYVTGEFGPRTQAAVREFQTANAIEPASGFVGEVTRQKINELLGR